MVRAHIMGKPIGPPSPTPHFEEVNIPKWEGEIMETFKSSGVKAVVNEKRFFASMKHLFASSFSVIGELLQNSRRAKATEIRINVDYENGTLSFEDDGHGIDDFAKLVEMSASGWDDETMLNETPFGMGFFSCFTSAARVEVRSKGRLLSACLDDVVSGELIQVTDEPNQLEGKTSVTLVDVSKEILDTASEYVATSFINKVSEIVKGFDLPVYVNGTMLDRPHAKENIGGVETEIGLISIAGLHRGVHQAVNLVNVDSSNSLLYLQGLPINNAQNRYYRSDTSIIHLDSAKFIAQMPDRTDLYDATVQLKKVDEVVKQVLMKELLERKAELSPEKFVCEYWHMAISLKALDIMNDLNVVPKAHFYTVLHACRSTDDADPFLRRGSEATFSKADIAAGNVRLWLNAPQCAGENDWAVTKMKVMQRENIYSFKEDLFDENHWVNNFALDVDGLKFNVNPSGESSREVRFTYSDVTTKVRLAESVEIIVTKRADPDCVIMRHVVTNDWLIAPVNQDEDSVGEPVFVWVIGENCESDDHPVNALNTFYDNPHFREDWEQDAMLEWDKTLANLRDEHTIKNVKRIMDKNHLLVPIDRVGDFGIVRVERHSSGDDKYDLPSLVFDEVDKSFMENLTAALRIETGNKGIDCNQVTRALLSIVRPDLHVGGPRDGEHIGQW